MTHATLELPAVGGRQVYDLPPSFGYEDSANLAVTVNELPATFSIVGRQIKILTPIVAAAGIVKVVRTTPPLHTDRPVSFAALSRLTGDDLNLDALHLLLLLQEADDQLEQGGDSSADGVHRNPPLTGPWDALARRVVNLADGTADGDLVTLQQLDYLLSAHNLPVVSGADNDSGLFVNAGAWAIRTPVQARAHLGLGTAAVLDVGTGASQLVQLDGSARYPANNGVNIDLAQHPLFLALALKRRTVSVHLSRPAFNAPSVGIPANWYENSSSRIGMNSPGAATRTEIDAGSSELDDNFTGASSRLELAQGTWLVRWVIRAKNTTGGGSDFDLGFRITDTTDGPSQVAYYAPADITMPSLAGQEVPTVIRGAMIFVAPTPDTPIVFRMANRAGNTLIQITRFNLLLQRLTP